MPMRPNAGIRALTLVVIHIAAIPSEETPAPPQTTEEILIAKADNTIGSKMNNTIDSKIDNVKKV